MSDVFHLSSAAAQIYEEQKVPAIFGPLAEATLDRVAMQEDDKVLDLACGTGIVARRLRKRIGSLAQITGLDLNPEMLALARQLPDKAARSCRWVAGDVTRLPFAEKHFSLAVCQQGLQFFPDPDGALLELRRVLRPGGRVAFTVWSDASDLFLALAEALQRWVDVETAERSLAPFTFEIGRTLGDRLEKLGYSQVSEKILTVDRVLVTPEEALPKEIAGNPIGPAVAAKGPAVMEKVVAETLAALTGYRQRGKLVIPQRAYLVQAQLP